MPRRKVEFRAGEFYHVYNRGNNHQRIFFERGNYAFFLRRLREYVVGDLRRVEPDLNTPADDISRSGDNSVAVEVIAYLFNAQPLALASTTREG